MRQVCFLVAFFAFCITACFRTVSAAEIQVLPSIEPNQKVIWLKGPVEEGDDYRFFDIAETTPQAVVILESPGGLVTEGISIAAEIAIRGYTTLVQDGSGCQSICAIMWVAGQHRYMTPDADISVHAAYRLIDDTNGSLETTISGVANAQIGAFLNQMGLSAAAIQYFTLAGPREDLLDITPEVAQTLSINVYVQYPDRTISPANRPTPRRIARQSTEFVALAKNCAALFQVDSTTWMEQAKTILMHGHEVFGSEVFSPLLGEYVHKAKTDLDDLGVVRWCLSTEQNLRNEDLRTGIEGPSYDCSRSSTLTEFMVCSSPDLWAIDRAMASLYFQYRENSGSSFSKNFLLSQRAWLARRDLCADNLDCLYERYSSRLFDFGH